MSLSRKLFLAAALALLTSTVSATAGAEDHDRAEEIYQLCAQCHGPDGAGDRVALAPPIAGLGEWYIARQLEKFRSGVRGMHPDDVGGMRMFPMSYTLKTDEDVAAVAAYVASMPPVYPEPVLEGGNSERGRPLYQVCVACHAADASGNELLGGPNLRVSSDWYMQTQLDNFRSGVRGANPKDAQGILMRPMAMQLPDEQAIKDVIAYIMTLSE